METKNIFSESGIIITLLLIAIPVIVASIWQESLSQPYKQMPKQEKN
jgi:hypothetical protein